MTKKETDKLQMELRRRKSKTYKTLEGIGRKISKPDKRGPKKVNMTLIVTYE